MHSFVKYLESQISVKKKILNTNNKILKLWKNGGKDKT